MAFRDALGRFRPAGALEGFLSDIAGQQTDWVNVVSSNVEAISWNPATFTLSVRFLNGSEYEYMEVPEEIYTSFLSASSKGKFLHNYIKGSYAYERAA